ncbi:MAG: DUF21 domain-containing protein, partial [Muribaculaceae bacterium]|nr:DUF21 domain-containing protein [Muribaculaceae bacterium]
MLLADAASATEQAVEFFAPTMGSIVAIVVALGGLVLSAFNSGSEIAFFSLTRDDVASIEDDERRARVEALLANPEKLLATILIGNNLVNIMIVIVLNYALSQMMHFHSSVASFLVQTVILTFLILLFGEIIPKLYATNYNVKMAQAVAGPLRLAVRLLSPLSRLLMKSTAIVDRMVTVQSDDISTEDLSHALEASNVQSGDEKELLEGILSFGDKTVDEIMRPRV